MKNLCVHVLIALSLVACLGMTLSAQRLPAWTRGLTHQSWSALTRSMSLRPTAKASFTQFPRKISLIKRIKTTDKKFIYHHVHYSQLFSKAEKEMLLKHIYPQATLGRIVYLYDKHAAFFSTLIDKDATAVNEAAFLRHQNILEQMLTGLETHYLRNAQEKFASEIFSMEEIARLQTQGQPPAYLLTVRELRAFSQLPSLAAQREWVYGQINLLEQHLQGLLVKDTFTLKPVEFESYYVQNMRLAYFHSLAGVLERTNAKRPSAIIRYRQLLPIPGETTPLTDAQRAGYLHFMADTTQNPAFNEHIKQFNTDYGPYAVAEALGLPYEVTLKNMYAPELLGVEEGAYLRQLSPRACLAEVTPKITELENQLAALRQQATQTPPFYTAYYQLHAKLQIYKTLTARANAIIELENFRR